MLPGIPAVGIEVTLRDQPLVAVPLLFAAGVATSLTPCVYPMIPITAGVLAGVGSAQRSRRSRLGYTLAYVVGLAAVYAGLGLLAGLTGTIFGTVSSNPWAYFAMGNLLLVFALAMLDVLPVRPPARLSGWAGRLGAASPGGAFLLGATSGLVAAPCGAPAFAAVLTFVTTTRSAALGFLYLLAFSLGMTALLLIVGLFSGMLGTLPRAGRWTLWTKRGAGVVLLAMAEYYFVRMGQVL
ncbi:MAG TPA: cytochrome c biogenesis protein CcdA [Gemmatimonadales bacterium]|nr:cytochrome c biogenesis protein CcdA [Gemmatimonadales bacterium]